MKAWFVSLLLVVAACKGDVAPDPVYEGTLVTMEDVDDGFADYVAKGPPRVRVPYKQEDAYRGAAEPLVTIVEFSDFQCPFCGRAMPTLDQIEKAYGDKVRIVFKHLPLGMHAKAPAAHAAAEAAHRQGKFWEMHDKIFANQDAMSPEKYREYAKEIGLDVARFDRDVADASLKKRIDDDAAEAARLGVSGTPAFFVNGRYLAGAVPFERIKVLLDEDLGKAS